MHDKTQLLVEMFKGQGRAFCLDPVGRAPHPIGWLLQESIGEKKLSSPAGNRTPVSRVTGGDTDHYTTEDCWERTHSFTSYFSWLMIRFFPASANTAHRGKLCQTKTYQSFQVKAKLQPSAKCGGKKISFEPDLNQRPMDFCIAVPTTVHRSTN